MSINKVVLSFITICLAGVGCLAAIDYKACVVSITVIPLLSGMMLFSIRQKHVSLCIFSALALVGHGIGSINLFLFEDEYAQTGWSAVKDFNFTLTSFFTVYYYVFFIFLSIAITIAALNKTFRRKSSANSATQSTEKLLIYVNMLTQKPIRSKKLLPATIVLALLLNIVMFNYRIGMTGVIPPELPLHISGLLFYVRSMIIPIVMAYLYTKSSKSGTLAFLFLVYAAASGVMSVSRSTLLLAALPVTLFALVQKQYLRLFLTIAFVAISIQIVTLARLAVYYIDAVSLFEVVFDPMLWSRFDWNFIGYFLKMLSSMLYGAQSAVLAYQYDLGDTLGGIFNIFTGKPVIDDMARVLYGMNLEGTGFGVAIGYLASLVMISKHSVATAILLGSVTALLLDLCEVVIGRIARIRSFISLLSLPLAFLMVFNLYGGVVAKYFTLLFSCIVFLTVYRILQVISSPDPSCRV